MTQPNEVYLLPGFKRRLAEIAANDDASFDDFAELLVMQPQAILYLLRIANEECGDREHHKPTSVQAIIGMLGTNRVEREIQKLGDVPLAQESELFKTAINSYELAIVISYLAESRLGRNVARDFFLLGLIDILVNRDPSLLEGCNEGIRRSWRSFSQDQKDKGEPMLEEARELVRELQKGNAKNASIDLCDEWRKGLRLVEEVIRHTETWTWKT